jgi:perosamine synthetase
VDDFVRIIRTAQRALFPKMKISVDMPTAPVQSTVVEGTARFLPVAEPDLSKLEEQNVLEAVRSGWVSSLGKFVTQFEQEFAAFCGAAHGVATSNGTTALHLALVAAGIGAGDEVIVPSLTFVATVAAVRHAGATPVFVDSDPVIGTMDPAAVERAFTPATRAIIPVHLFGHPADMDPIRELARSRGVFVLEDAAESHGARYRGRRVGGLGDASCFSFYGNKVMTTGEGGMVVTNDLRLVERLRFLRDHAMDPKRRYWHPEVGFNYRLTNPQAALGVAQLSRFEEITERRQRVLDNYRELAADAELPLSFNPGRSWATTIPWLVCAILRPGTEAGLRERLFAGLHERGIDTRPYFVPIHVLPPYVGFRRVSADSGDQLVHTESLASRGFNLPSSGSLTRDDISRVVAAIGDVLS